VWWEEGEGGGGGGTTYRMLKTPLQAGSLWDSLKSPSSNSCSPTCKYSLKELLHKLQEMLVKFRSVKKRKAKFFTFTTFSRVWKFFKDFSVPVQTAIP